MSFWIAGALLLGVQSQSPVPKYPPVLLHKRDVLVQISLDTKWVPGTRMEDPGGSEAKAAAYQALFETATVSELDELCKDPDLSLALQARWEKVRAEINLGPSGDASAEFKGAAADGFFSFFTDRVGYSPPKWWVLVSRSTWVPPSAHTGNPSLFPPEVKRDFSQVGVTRTDDGELTTVTDGVHTLRFTNTWKWRGMFTVFDGDRAYVAAYGAVVSYPFPLTCFDVKTGKPVWSQTVWGAFRGGFGGFGWHCATLAVHGDEVAVFGMGGSYAEGFNKGDGTPRYRFCPWYWMNQPEKWHTAWNALKAQP